MGQDTIQDCAALGRKVRELRREQKVTQAQLAGLANTGIRFIGGCDGNLKAIAKLVDGWTVEQIEAKLKGNTCGPRPTSCADQLAIAVRKAYNELHAK